MSLLKRAIDEELARRRRAARADPENLAARDKSSRQDTRAIQGRATLSEKQLREGRHPMGIKADLQGRAFNRRWEFSDSELDKYPITPHEQFRRASPTSSRLTDWVRDNYVKTHEYPRGSPVPTRLRSAIGKLKKLRGK